MTRERVFHVVGTLMSRFAYNKSASFFLSSAVMLFSTTSISTTSISTTSISTTTSCTSSNGPPAAAQLTHAQ
ncbi:MAG: hypothetical protein EOO65_01815 [Methanosarcinales archaeon]|nr:MAG: hypothetical protein EOO65_01815 [Methanosarcinales archaeon]